jgi:DNA-binding NtrC family response regulator
MIYSYDWPGNVRELSNAITKGFYLSTTERITKSCFSLTHASPAIDATPIINAELFNADHPSKQIIPLNGQQPDSTNSAKYIVNSQECIAIEEALNQCSGHVSKAAQILNMPVSSLYRKIRQCNLKKPKCLYK